MAMVMDNLEVTVFTTDIEGTYLVEEKETGFECYVSWEQLQNAFPEIF